VEEEAFFDATEARRFKVTPQHQHVTDPYFRNYPWITIKNLRTHDFMGEIIEAKFNLG